jgi:hypothetical protein
MTNRSTNPDVTQTAELGAWTDPTQYDSRPAALIEAQAAYTNALTQMGLTLTDLRHFEWAADLALLRG